MIKRRSSWVPPGFSVRVQWRNGPGHAEGHAPTLALARDVPTGRTQTNLLKWFGFVAVRPQTSRFTLEEGLNTLARSQRLGCTRPAAPGSTRVAGSVFAGLRGVDLDRRTGPTPNICNFDAEPMGAHCVLAKVCGFGLRGTRAFERPPPRCRAVSRGCRSWAVSCPPARRPGRCSRGSPPGPSWRTPFRSGRTAPR